MYSNYKYTIALHVLSERVNVCVCVCATSFVPLPTQESILAQLAEEEKTRERLLYWDQQLHQVTTLAEEVGGARMICDMGRLADVTLESAKSPLAAGYCLRLWTVLTHGVIEEWELGEDVSV